MTNKMCILLCLLQVFLGGCESIPFTQLNTDQCREIWDERVIHAIQYERHDLLSSLLTSAEHHEKLYSPHKFDHMGRGLGLYQEDNLLAISADRQMNMIPLLLELGANPNTLAYEDDRPAFAHFPRNQRFLELAYEHGADFNLTYGKSNSLLKEAIGLPDAHLVRFLIDHNVTVSESDFQFAQSAVNESKNMLTSQIIVELLKQELMGSNYQLSTDDLLVACAIGDTEKIRTEYNKKISKANNVESPMAIAVAFQQIDAVRVLYDLGESLEQIAPKSYAFPGHLCGGSLAPDALLGVAAYQNDIPMLNTIVKLGVPTDNASITNAIEYGVLADAAEAIELLLDMGGSDWVKYDNEQYHPVLSLACSYGNPEVIAAVLQAYSNAGLASPDLLGEALSDVLNTKLNLTCHLLPAIKILIEHGADMNTIGDDGAGALPINMAIVKGYPDIVKYLLDSGAVITEEDGSQASICLAAASGPNVLNLVLGYTDKIDIKDQDGQTALMYAVGNLQYENVATLLKHGADLTIHDNDGRVAQDYLCGLTGDVIQTLIENKGTGIHS